MAQKPVRISTDELVNLAGAARPAMVGTESDRTANLIKTPVWKPAGAKASTTAKFRPQGSKAKIEFQRDKSQDNPTSSHAPETFETKCLSKQQGFKAQKSDAIFLRCSAETSGWARPMSL